MSCASSTNNYRPFLLLADQKLALNFLFANKKNTRHEARLLDLVLKPVQVQKSRCRQWASDDLMMPHFFRVCLEILLTFSQIITCSRSRLPKLVILSVTWIPLVVVQKAWKHVLKRSVAGRIFWHRFKAQEEKFCVACLSNILNFNMPERGGRAKSLVFRKFSFFYGLEAERYFSLPKVILLLMTKNLKIFAFEEHSWLGKS